MEDIEAMLCAYVEGDLDAAGRAQIELHLANHPQHKKLIEELIAQRQLLRDLPRAAAPRDVDESVRGQMERSILLDDAASQSFSRASGRRRVPQLMTAAAVILLSTALGLIVYRVVVPTFKPAKFTPVASSQQPANTQSEIETDIKQSQDQVVTDQLQTESGNEQTPLAAASPAPQLQQAQQFAAAAAPVEAPIAVPRQVVTSDDLPIDLNQLRKTLRENGYELTPKTDQQNPSIVVAIVSSDPATTDDLVAKYLAGQKTISWSGVARTNSNGISSSSLEGAAPATTVPSTGQYSLSEAPLMHFESIAYPEAALPATQPATQPSTRPSMDWVLDSVASTKPSEPSQDVYIVHGLTRQQADDLATSIGGFQSGVSLQTAEDSSLVPATRPAAGPLQALGMATTRADEATTRPASPATMPSEPQIAEQFKTAIGGGVGGGGLSDTSQLVDAVIVIQASPPSTQPAIVLPTTAPATQPDRIAVPSTEPSSH
jgi:hypothetical protein